MTTHPVLIATESTLSLMRDMQRINESLFPPRTFRFSRKIVIAVILSIASLIFTGLFLYQAHAQSVPSPSNMDSGTVYLSAQAAAEASSTPVSTVAPMLEIHIANNGLVLLRGARVISISGSSIRVDMKWGSADFTWVIQTNSNTKFITSTGEKETLAKISVGDIVTVTGMLIGGGTESTIDAEFVRE